MFDAERLLGKMIGGAVGGGGSSPLGAIAGELASGKGLMTVIGLGVGAFEVLKEQREGAPKGVPPPPPSPPCSHGGPGSAGGQGHGPSVPPDAGSVPPPPPPPGLGATPPVPGAQGGRDSLSSQEVAVRMIQAMIAAAHADGTLDEEEERVILDRLGSGGLSQEEQMFLLGEMKNPRSIEELAQGMEDPKLAAAMYAVAFSAICVDTEAERKWLDTLAERLGLSRNVQEFLEKRE